MTTDLQQLKGSVNILDLAGHYSTLRKKTAHEWEGPCPRCGGRDRFTVNDAEGWFFCRECRPQRGDVIDLLRWAEDLTWKDALSRLGADPGTAIAPRSAAATPRATPQASPPPQGWQGMAQALVTWAQEKLWADPQALAYLRGRGLTDETIKAARLGYNPTDLYRDPDRWGIKDPDCKTVWIPAGWVIPCEAGGQLWYVKVRRLPATLAAAEDWNKAHPDQKPRPVDKYVCIRGSIKRGAIYGLETVPGHTDVVMAEGEFNALVLRQSLQGVAAVVSVGDAGNQPGAGALAILHTARRWFLAFDPDKAGRDGAEHLAQEYHRARVLSWPWRERGDKYDINDAYKDGEDLAAWAIPYLAPDGPSLARARWLEHHLMRLDQAAFDAGPNEKDPALRVWLALLGELNANGDVASFSGPAPELQTPPAVAPQPAPTPAPDPLARFMADCTRPDNNGAVPAEWLLAAYGKWAITQGLPPLGDAGLEAQLEARGYRLEDREAGPFWFGFYLIV